MKLKDEHKYKYDKYISELTRACVHLTLHEFKLGRNRNRVNIVTLFITIDYDRCTM